jgi:hypothetical protein
MSFAICFGRQRFKIEPCADRPPRAVPQAGGAERREILVRAVEPHDEDDGRRNERGDKDQSGDCLTIVACLERTQLRSLSGEDVVHELDLAKIYPGGEQI